MQELPKLLIVDQNPDVLKTIQVWFAQKKYTVFTADSASNALQILEKHPIHVLISDLHLSDMSGIQLIHKSKAHRPDIQSIIITGNPELDSAIEAMKAGTLNYLKKPVDLIELTQTIENTLNNKWGDSPAFIKILLVEDAKAVRKLEVKMLNTIGYQTIIEASNGAEAIQLLEKEQDFGLIISDWNMPKQSGLDLLKWMRQTHFYKNTPFIMATGQGEKRKVMEAIQAGAQQVVTKPFSPFDFKNAIEQALGIEKKSEDKTVSDIKQSKSGKTLLRVAHIPITDHIVLGATKHFIDTGEFVPSYFDLEIHRMLLWNPVQVALEKGNVDAVFILAPIAMDLFHFGLPIKLILLAHKNGSICVKNKTTECPTDTNLESTRHFFKHKTFYLPHLLSVHHMFSHIFMSGIGMTPGLTDNQKANVFFEVIPPIMMPDFQSKDKDVAGFMVAEPIGSKAIKTGVGDLLFLSSELWPNHPCCVVVIREDYIEKYPEAVQEFTSMMVQAGKKVASNPYQAAQIALNFLDPDKKIGLKLPILEMVLNTPGGITTDSLYPSIPDLDFIQRYMKEKVGYGDIIDLEKFVDTRFADLACPSEDIIQPSSDPDISEAVSAIIQRYTTREKQKIKSISEPVIPSTDSKNEQQHIIPTGPSQTALKPDISSEHVVLTKPDLQHESQNKDKLAPQMQVESQGTENLIPQDKSQIVILLVEDAKAVRKLEINMLNGLGFLTVLEANDGAEAIEVLENNPNINLVISDWNMPKKTGFDLLIWMRNHKQFHATPFIMATGQGEKKKVERAKLAGANNFITKPFSPMDLKLAVEQTLGLIKNNTESAKRLQKTTTGKALLKVAHIPITDHVVLGAVKHLIQTGKFNPRYFELETHRMMLWNPVQVALEKGEVDAVLILAPIAMDLFSYGAPIKLILFAHKNGSICVRNKKGEEILSGKDGLKQFFNRKTFYLPHLLSVHHMFSHSFLSGIGMKPGLTDDVNANVYFEVIPPVMMPDFQSKDKDVGGFMVAEPIGTKAVATGVGEQLFLSSEVWKDHPCCVVAMRTDFIQAFPEAVQEFTTMMVKAGKFVSKHPDQAAQIAVDFLDPDKTIGLKVPVLEKVLSDSHGLTTHDLFPVKEDLAFIQNYMVNQMGIGTPINMDEFVDTRFAEVAYKQSALKRKRLPPNLLGIIDRFKPASQMNYHDPKTKKDHTFPEIIITANRIRISWRSHSLYPNPSGFFVDIQEKHNKCSIFLADVGSHEKHTVNDLKLIKSFIRENRPIDWKGNEYFDMLNAMLVRKKLSHNGIKGMQITIYYDTETGEMVSAGLPPMIIFKKHIPQAIGGGGVLLGLKNQSEWPLKQFNVSPKNRIYFHSDGVIKVFRESEENTQKKMLNYDGLDDFILRHWQSSFGDMIVNIWQDILSYCDHKPEQDMVLISIEL